MYFSREFVSMEIFLWAMCSQDIFTRINKRTATHTHTHRTPFTILPMAYSAHTNTYTTSRCHIIDRTSHSGKREKTHTVCWNSFICIQRTKILYCFFRFNFPFGDFWNRNVSLFFILRLSIHYYYYYQQQKRDSSLVWCLVTLAFEYLFKL